MGRLFIRNIEVDMVEDVNTSLNYSLLDIQNPVNKQTNYSKSIKLPATNPINQIFEYIFNLDVTLSTFNPNKKEPAIYYSNESEIFAGHVRLKKIERNLDKQTNFYILELFGELSSLFRDIGEKLVTGNPNPADDLDFSEYDHELNYTNVVNSWATSNIVSGSPVSLGGLGAKGYRYALANYGTEAEYFLNNSSNYNPDIDFAVNNMRPVIFRYELLKKIFDKAGWVWDSAFLNGTRFGKIVHPCNNDVLSLSQSQIDNNRYYVNDNVGISNTVAMNPIGGSSATFVPTLPPYNTVIFNNEASPFYDTGANNNTTTGIFNTPLQSTYIITFQTTVNAELSIPTTPVGRLMTSFTGIVRLSIDKEVSPGVWTNIHYQDFNYNQTNAGTFVLSQSFQTTKEVYDIVNTKYRCTVGYGSLVGTMTSVITGGNIFMKILDSYLYVRLKNNNVVEGMGVVYSFNQVLPKNKKQKDFLIDSIREFNLWMIEDKLVKKKMIIEPYENWFDPINVEDWTALRDTKAGESYELLSLLDNKTFHFAHKPNSDYWSKKYTERNLYNYGDAVKDIDNDFLNGTNKIELTTSSSPLIGNDSNGLLIPQIYSIDNGVIKPIKHNLRSMLWGGLINMDGGYWTLWSLGNPTNFSQYPYIGHLDDPYNPTFDFLFENPSEIFYERPVLNYTNNNLYNAYWKGYVDQLSNPNSKVVTRNYWLSEKTIKELTWRKRIFDDGHYFILYSIENYTPDSNQSTTCKLLKLSDYVAFIPSGEAPGGSGGGGNAFGSSKVAASLSSFLIESATPSGMRLAAPTSTKKVSINSDSTLPSGKFTIIEADASGGDITITLNNVGFEFMVVRVDNTVGTSVFLQPDDATVLIDFAANYTLTTQGELVKVIPVEGAYYVQK
jgi:hypothetical protein